VTEQEWLACTDPTPMLEFLRRRASDRKLRLFACACCRQVWNLLSPEDQGIVARVEQCADGHFNLEDVRRRLRVQFPNSLFEEWDISDWGDIRRRLREEDPQWLLDEELDEVEAESGWFPEILFLPNPGRPALITARQMHRWKEESIKIDTSRRTKPVREHDLEAWQATWDEIWDPFDAARAAARETGVASQVAILRDLFGNPFRPSPRLTPDLLAWNDGTVRRLAEGIYEDRAFDRLPILADALEEAGCTDQAILDHCRHPGPHVRGCWVVDLLLGKE
jgi:hypothetical protein